MLHAMTQHGLRADAAISVWVLQHCMRPQEDISLIRDATVSQGRLCVVNTVGRAVPAKEPAWVNDGLDIRAMLSDAVTELAAGRLAADVVSERVSRHSFWATYARGD
jgi:hypothetical protein